MVGVAKFLVRLVGCFLVLMGLLLALFLHGSGAASSILLILVIVVGLAMILLPPRYHRAS